MGTLDFRAEEFWELSELDQELRRVYEICGAVAVACCSVRPSRSCSIGSTWSQWTEMSRSCPSAM
jgi:hypothetical protein